MSSQLILSPGREKSLDRRHPWIFAGAVAKTTGRLHSGDTVDVLSSKGKWLARAAWSPNSQIRARVWSFDQDEVIDNGFFERKIGQAIALRESLAELGKTNAMRLVAAESDGLPGIIIDRYANLLIFQLLSAGADKHRDKIVWALNRLFPECQLYERSDAEVRQKEGLEPVTKAYAEDMPDEVLIEENDSRFFVNYQQGHKTGFYLDQRRNRELIADFVKDRTVLNCFSYTGAMGVVCLNAGASHVTQADKSADALALAARHLEENGCDPDKSELVQADVFALLREYRQQERHFDVIILDPPKFVDSRQHLNKACRGYKDINLLAMQLLNPGGTLATFSCSGLMPEDLFGKIVADAALDAKRQVRYLHRLSQAVDHPVSSAFPEGHYLKGLICHVT